MLNLIQQEWGLLSCFPEWPGADKMGLQSTERLSTCPLLCLQIASQTNGFSFVHFFFLSCSDLKQKLTWNKHGISFWKLNPEIGFIFPEAQACCCASQLSECHNDFADKAPDLEQLPQFSVGFFPERGRCLFGVVICNGLNGNGFPSVESRK